MKKFNIAKRLKDLSKLSEIEAILDPNELPESKSHFDERQEEEFLLEGKVLSINPLDYFNQYPEYFRDQLKDLYNQGNCYFKLEEHKNSPLLWLLVNRPHNFNFACMECLTSYRQEVESIKLKKNNFDSEKQIELQKLMDELNSEDLLNGGLLYYQETLQRKLSKLYLNYEQLKYKNLKEAEEYKKEKIDVFESLYGELLDKSTVKHMKENLLELQHTMKDLVDLIKKDLIELRKKNEIHEGIF